MGVDGGPPSCLDPPSAAGAPERRQWQRIFGALLEMLRQRQRQVETLASDRRFLHEYVHLRHDQWSSKAFLLESLVSQEVEMEKRVEAAKRGLMVALKQREASYYKELAENADNDLRDFCECVEILSCEVSVLKEKLEDGKSKETCIGEKELCNSAGAKDREEEQNNSSGLRELRKWKDAYKKLSSMKEAEVSALLDEKDFVSHQFKKMESDYTDLLKNKQVEVDQANDALQRFQANMEELRSSSKHKDETISKLKDDTSRIELVLRSRTEEAQRTGEELKKLHLDMEKVQASMKEKDDMIAKLLGELPKHDVPMRHCSNRKSRLSKESTSSTRSRGELPKHDVPMRQCSNRKSRLSKESTSSTRSRGELPKHDVPMRQCSNRKSRLSKESTSSTRLRGRSVPPSGRHQGIPLSRGSCLSNSSSGARTASTEPKRCSKKKSAPVVPISMLHSQKLFPSTFKVPKLKNISSAV